jgi:hypothetical protein
MNQKDVMKSLFGILLLSIFCFTSCKKEDEIIEIEQEIYNPNVAPCEIAELNYQIVFYGPSNFFPQAKFRVKFYDTTWICNYTVEFGFNKIPTTGMYYMMYELDTSNLTLPNQISYIRDTVCAWNVSSFTQTAEVYIENNNDELIISYCNISNSDYYFDNNCNCSGGNMMKNVKAIKKY